LLAWLAFAAQMARAWEQLDYDIFDLVDDVRREHGEDATFYSVLGLDQSATTAQIIKAHRKLSLGVHPDKNPSKEAQRVFTRLGSITGMLKDSEKRERYEFFLKNGVPTWRGTGYYYKRHRPGLGSVLVALGVFGSAVHYLLMYVGWWRGRERWQLLQEDVR
ncbi:DnaJ domain-containing protein, partial [Thamnocephalis sphaerospora]